ncbi:tetratricopeptide repeat protein [Acidipila rosea]|uniref:Tetratricopeptide repeat protein n=1 Tax=Acidipila rosea TaxID=768535 RepID=A0A4R1LDQ6_9BACT|nr:tetratricopeptide repeat protein [Acidipila rosea]
MHPAIAVPRWTMSAVYFDKGVGVLRSGRVNGSLIYFLRCVLVPLLAVAVAELLPARAQRPDTAYRDTILAIQQQIQTNHLDNARALLTSALSRYPTDGGLENLLGIVEIQEGHIGRAKKAFLGAVSHSPRLGSAYLNLGRVYMETAEADPKARAEALQVYKALLRMDPVNAEANYEQATILTWDRDYQRSLESLQKLDSKAHMQISVETLICTDEFGLGHNKAGERAATSMSASPDLTEQDAMKVLPALRTAHRADLVDTLFTAANKRQPLSASGLRILGLAQEAEGKPEQARATLERVFAMDPTSIAPLVDLARIAAAGKDYRSALGYLAHARALQPNDPSLPYEFGMICLKLELLGEASKAVVQAVRMAPDNPDYNFGMGSIWSLEHDPGQALPYLRKYHDLRPADAEGTLALGTAYLQEEDLKNATIWLSKAADAPSTAARAHYYLGNILREQQQYDQAIAQLQESAHLKADEPKVYAELGRVYLQMKSYPEAKRQLDHALALDPDNYEANFALLRFYSFTNDPRREEQSKRFADIKKNREKLYLESMRVIEARPQTESP